MFSYSKGGVGKRTPNPPLSPPPSVHAQSRPASRQSHDAITEFLRPSTDVPPSPETSRSHSLRAYSFLTKSSFKGSLSRSSQFSSVASSAGGSECGENPILSRPSSRRSSAGGMPSRKDRGERFQIFGKRLFSRSSKKSKYDGESGELPISELAPFPVWVDGSSVQNGHFENRSASRASTRSNKNSRLDLRSQTISAPFNFEHIVHTRPSNDIGDSSLGRNGQESTFGPSRVSMLESHHLLGVRAHDLHFENFSSEAVNQYDSRLDLGFRPASSSDRHRNTMSKSSRNSRTSRILRSAQSCDSLRIAPPRPMMYPSGTDCPVLPPPRTSSRVTSMLSEKQDLMATTTLEGPLTTSGYRRSTAFHLPTSVPRPLSRNQQVEDFLVATDIQPKDLDEVWPLPPTAFESVHLEDVPEEEEVTTVAAKRPMELPPHVVLRTSKSVPNLSSSSKSDSPFQQFNFEIPPIPETASMAGDDIPKDSAPSGEQSIDVLQDGWEDAVDYVYKHEAEADCDYEWDRNSVTDDELAKVDQCESPILPPSSENLDRSVDSSPQSTPPLLHLSIFGDRKPSPMANSSSGCIEPLTPSVVTPLHLRTPSHASSFKESHGFTLSPSLLIPNEYSQPIDHDELFDSFFATGRGIDNFHMHLDDQYAISPVEDQSPTASIRSSGYSHASNLTLSQSGSQESMLSRSSNLASHRSNYSSGSLPDLVHSRASKQHSDAVQRATPPAPAPVIVHNPSIAVNNLPELSRKPTRTHGRNDSAPVNSAPQSARENGRRRAATLSHVAAKSRTSYTLFPAIPTRRSSIISPAVSRTPSIV